jgi:hypothetical protein
MKKSNLIALLLIAAATALLLYNFLIVQPYLFDPTEEDFTRGFDYELHSHYRQLSDWCGLAGTVLAGVGMILGLVVVIKAKNKSGWISVLAGAAVSFMSFIVAFAHVV